MHVLDADDAKEALTFLSFFLCFLSLSRCLEPSRSLICSASDVWMNARPDSMATGRDLIARVSNLHSIHSAQIEGRIPSRRAFTVLRHGWACRCHRGLPLQYMVH